MTQEDKELLLKDLSGRLSYKVKVTTTNAAVKFGVISGISIENKISVRTKRADIVFNCTEVKPYLFPLSSIAKEHRKKISEILKSININHPPYGLINPDGCDSLLTTVTMQGAALIKFYNKYHYDYNGLIPMGLANDATGLNIY